jgi:UDP-glucuronate 4-epimerase
VNDAYSPILKEWRLARIQKFSNFEFHRMDITNLDALKGLFQQHKFDAVMNLAARAGVKISG